MQEQYSVGIYARLSRDDERAGESVSIENQKEMLARYVREQGWTLYDYYCDDGVSGTTFDRPELDRLVQSAYEDKVLGKIPENLCVQLLNGYEAERRAKQERRRELTEQLAASRENEQSVDAWLDMVQDYYNLEELDRPTLVRLIQKIEVGEKRMVDGHEERDFNIYYNFIGHIDL